MILPYAQIKIPQPKLRDFYGGTDEARFRLSGRRRSLRPNRRLGVPAGAGTSLRRSRLVAGQAQLACFRPGIEKSPHRSEDFFWRAVVEQVGTHFVTATWELTIK